MRLLPATAIPGPERPVGARQHLRPQQMHQPAFPRAICSPPVGDVRLGFPKGRSEKLEDLGSGQLLSEAARVVVESVLRERNEQSARRFQPSSREGFAEQSDVIGRD